MSNYLEIQFEPNAEQQRILSMAEGDDFPWYFQESTDPKYMVFCHVLMKRNPQDLPETGVINSHMYELFKTVFDAVCKEHNVTYTKVLRAAINNVGHYPDLMGDIHNDHSFPHKNFILYLNDFTGAPTYFFDDSKNLVYKSTPGRNRGIFFNGQFHASGFCAPYEHRIAMVFTFI